MGFVVANDYTLFTHNSVDFRGNGPGKLGGEHAKQPIHCGLVCLNSVYIMDLERQRYLFEVALQELAGMADLVNRALELFELADGSVEIEVYEIPES